MASETAETVEGKDRLPVRLEPILLERPWGGDGLARVFHKDLPAGARIGESWEVCDLLQGARRWQCRLASGIGRGRPLGEVLEEDTPGWLGTSPREVYAPGTFPLLVKFLDARQTLSIQVHPDHEHCERLEGVRRGKTEAWVVLRAEPGARIHRGIREGVERDEARDLVRRGRIREILRSFPAREGDVIFLPPGTVHALGEGLLVAEIQESSDFTYRIDDWDRVGPDGKGRALHREKAAEVVRVQDRGEGDLVTPVPMREGGGVRLERLVEGPAFRLDRWRLEVPFEAAREGGAGAVQVLLVLSGAGRIAAAGVEEPYRGGDAYLIPASVPPWRVIPEDASVLLRAVPGVAGPPRSRRGSPGKAVAP